MDLTNKYIFDGLFGLERETLRVTSDGSLASSPHPFADNKYLDRDFCENQLEIITPPCESIEKAMQNLRELDAYTRNELNQRNELLWIYSNPPRIKNEDDIIIADFTGSERFKHDYRIKLERRYGKRLMLYSGIHFNFSFSDKLLKSINSEAENYEEFKNSLYFRLSKQIFRYSWLLVMLTAASPVYDLSLYENDASGNGFDGNASMRGSEKGYWNKFIPILDYSDLYSYIKSIQAYIENGSLFSEGELYLPMRLKPHGNNNLSSLKTNGVNHIELRMFDLNPLSPIGIFEEDLSFAHYFMIYLTQLPDFEFTPELQKTAVQNHRSASGYYLEDIKINGYPASEAALGLLDDMALYFKNIPKVLENIELQKKKLLHNKRYCVLIYDMLHEDYQEKMLEISKRQSDLIKK